MKITSIALLLLICGSINAQSLEQKLLGTWKLTAVQKSGGLDIDASIIPMGSDEKAEKKVREDVLLFMKNGDLDNKTESGQYRAKYLLTDSLLAIGPSNDLGEPSFRIITLNSDSLVLESTKGIFSTETLIYLRQSKELIPIEPYQQIKEFHENGKPSTIGLRENGLEHGIWIEYREDGSMESVQYFQNGIPYMQVEFDEKGNVSDKKWTDFNTREIRTD
jgi:hypothetical protein